MKITDEHYEYLKSEIERQVEHNPSMEADYKKLGLSKMRFRWDILRDAGCMRFVCVSLYSYLNDDHIDTALRKIFGHDK